MRYTSGSVSLTAPEFLELELPCDATLADVAHALVVACPALQGLAITTDGTGLLESYALNLNGRVFVTDTGVHLQ
jgi:hypothetical protein